MTTTTNRPHGILYDHDPSITRDSLVLSYSVPDVGELRRVKEAARRTNSRALSVNLGKKWQPVHHVAWIDAVRNVALDRGLAITDEKFALSDDRHDLFALFEFEEKHGDVAAQDSVSKVIALRTSNMQRHKSEGRTGGRVVVCSNGIMTGQFMLGHKQTTNLDPLSLVREGFDKWVAQQDQLADAIGIMKDRTLTGSQVFELLGRAVIGTADATPFLSGATARRVIAEYESPAHEVFAPRNAWSLYNAGTEVMKTEKRMSNDTAERLQLGLAKILVGT